MTGGDLCLAPGGLWVGYAVSGLVAGLVGVADILGKYKDNPLLALSTGAALQYVLANGAFGVLAFWLAYVLDMVGPKVGGGGHGSIDLVKNGLIVGFGAIFILRGVAFKLAIGGKASDVGPSTIVDALLATFDQSINRTVGQRKDSAVGAIMAGVSFAKASDILPSYCLSLLEKDDALAARVGVLVETIQALDLPGPDADRQKALLLGNSLMAAFGPRVTLAAVKRFGRQIAADPPA